MMYKISIYGGVVECMYIYIYIYIHVYVQVETEEHTITGGFSSFHPLQSTPHTVIIASGFSLDISTSDGPLPWPRVGTLPEQPPPSVQSNQEHLLTITTLVHPAGSWDTLSDQRSLPYLSHQESSDPKYSLLRSSTGLLSINAHVKEPGHFALTCLDYHPDPLTVEIRASNSPTPHNPHPITTKAWVKVYCHPPLSLLPAQLALGVGTSASVQVSRPECKQPWCPVAEETEDEVELEALLGLFPLLRNVSFSVDHPSIALSDPTGMRSQPLI